MQPNRVTDIESDVAIGYPVNQIDHYPLLQPMKDTYATYNNNQVKEEHGVPEGEFDRQSIVSTGSVSLR